MAQRHSPHRVSSTSTKRYPLRRSPPSRRRPLVLVNSLHHPLSHASSSSSIRPVLVPLHPNLRRLPSRLLLKESAGSMQHHVHAGTKRKRVPGTNENAHSGGRGSGRLKRRRSSSRRAYSSDEDQLSEMEVDSPSRWSINNDSDEEQVDEDDTNDSTDDHLINDAAPRQLLRLRKDDLIRLYTAAGLSEDDPELLTKPEIVQALVAARDDIAELPPSSPPGPSSDGCSSDDGNVAGGEETDIGAGAPPGRWGVLRRRATVGDMGRTSGKPVNTRSLSTGNLASKPAKMTEPGRRRNNASSSRSSPTISGASASLPSPPATRLRSRKVSNATTETTKGNKGKVKQVEFSDDVEVHDAEEESDLTELDEEECDGGALNVVTPSPRRLRSKGQKERTDEEVEERRVTPMRKAKGKIGSLKEEDSQDDEEEESGEEDQLEEADEDEEVDELVSSPSPSPAPSALGHNQGRRTPVKRRLRPRRVQTYTPPSDGDDEGEGVEESVEGEEGEEGEDGEESEDGEGEETEKVAEPRKLRNGKIVGEEELGEDEDEEEEGEEESVDDDAAEDIDIDIDADGETEESDESMDDVDLTIATTKTLVRLRRDDLVRLCSSRDLDVGGTKPQLAEALLEWRDRQSATDFSSPSSAGTVRPPSTVRPRRRKGSNGNRKSKSPLSPVPVLMRAEHFHADEPRTPPLSSARREKEAEPELELDLESLGLEDREIPPEKLTKLEKIGSGGFKDVFVGKFKGRKIAISEFRGQLSAMDIKELKLLGGFDHPNIVRFLGVSIPENTRETPVMIVSELCSNGDLFDYVRNVPPPSLHKVLGMMLDIARGLEYLHLRKPSVIHRDCKSSNILITSRGTAKIADFGLAKVKQSTRSMVRSLVGTVNWQAPELWHAHPKYNHKVDVFSCAMVYWEMLQWHLPNKKFPWEGMNEHAIYDIVGAKRQRPSISGLRKQWCPEIVDLIERMWAHEHQDRPTISEVVEELEALVSHR